MLMVFAAIDPGTFFVKTFVEKAPNYFSRWIKKAALLLLFIILIVSSRDPQQWPVETTLP